MPPCGVPVTGCTTVASSSNIPAFSHFWISRRNGWSSIRCLSIRICQSWSTVSKKLSMSRFDYVSIPTKLKRSLQLQCGLTCAPIRAIPMTALEKISLINAAQNQRHRCLQELIFYQWQSKRTTLGLPLGYPSA